MNSKKVPWEILSFSLRNCKWSLHSSANLLAPKKSEEREFMNTWQEKFKQLVIQLPNVDKILIFLFICSIFVIVILMVLVTTEIGLPDKLPSPPMTISLSIPWTRRLKTARVLTGNWSLNGRHRLDPNTVPPLEISFNQKMKSILA